MEKDYEYRVKVTTQGGNEVPTQSTSNPKEAGKLYRNVKQHKNPGEIIELQKREVLPWQTVEKSNE